MKSTVMNSLIGLSSALFLMGCASSDYDDSDHGYTTTETVTTTKSADQMALNEGAGTEIVEASGAQPAQSGNEWVIPLHEEQMNVGKRTVDSGEVTLRKVVTSEQVSQPVELRKETLIIEREPAGASRESAGANTGLFEENAVTIRLHEEQPVVEKTVVETGQVKARKSAELNKQEIQGQVRREDIQVDRSGDTAGASQVIEESAGAERPKSSEHLNDE